MHFYQEPNFKRHVLEVAVLTGLLLVAGTTGCGGFKERRESEATSDAAKLSAERASAFERTTKAGPQPAVVIEGKDGTKIQVTPPPASEHVIASEDEATKASSKGFSSYSDIESYPWGIKLILIAIGLAALFFVLRLIWGYIKSTGVGEGISAADSVLADQIHKLEERRGAATLQSEIAQHSTDIASLQKERGKLLARKKR